jgi:hypothetical protein
LKHSTLTIAGLLCIAGAVHAAPEDVARTLSFCDEKAQLVLISDTLERAQAVAAQLDKLAQPVCVRPGPHTGAFLIKGTLNAMDVGVIPQGDRSALVVQSPRYLTLPVTAYVEAKN